MEAGRQLLTHLINLPSLVRIFVYLCILQSAYLRILQSMYLYFSLQVLTHQIVNNFPQRLWHLQGLWGFHSAKHQGTLLLQCVNSDDVNRDEDAEEDEDAWDDDGDVIGVRFFLFCNTFVPN